MYDTDMTPGGVSTGSDLPELSADDQKAFEAMESEANSQRDGMKGMGGQTVRIPPAEDEPEPPAAVTPPVPPAQAAPTPPAAAPVAAIPGTPQPSSVEADDNDPNAVLATDGKKYLPVSVHVNARKNWQGQLADEKARNETLTTQFKQLLEAHNKLTGQPPAPAAAAPPPSAPETNPFDKSTHPIEHLEWDNAQLKKGVDDIHGWRKSQEETAAQTKAFSEARNAYTTIHQSFTAQTPGYDVAYRWLMDKWTVVNEAMGMSKAEAIQAANQMEWSMVGRASHANQNPSAMLFAVAKAAGWTPEVPSATTAAPAVGAPGVAPAAQTAPTPQQAITLAQQGAAAAISLSDAAGGSPPAVPTLASIAKMSKEEYAQTFSGPKGEALFKKLAMGGAGTMAA